MRKPAPVREALACDHRPNASYAQLQKAGWSMQRPPKCNRPPGHTGEHREYSRTDAMIRWRWER